MKDTEADRQFNGSSVQISHPHTDQTRVHCCWPTRTAHPLSLPTLNGLVEKTSHKLADEQRGETLPPLLPPPPALSLSHMLSLSFLYQVVVSISPNPFSPECLKRWKDKEKEWRQKSAGLCYNPAPERLLMKEFGDGRDRDRRGDTEREGESWKEVFQATKTGHFCIEGQTKVQSSLLPFFCCVIHTDRTVKPLQ